MVGPLHPAFDSFDYYLSALQSGKMYYRRKGGQNLEKMSIREMLTIEDQNTDEIHLYKGGVFWKAYQRLAYLLLP